MQPPLSAGKSNARIVDSHIHLDQIAADGLRGSLIENERYHALIPGINPEQFNALQQRADLARFDRAIGWHPWYLPDKDPDEVHGRILAALANDERVVGFGETGLDAIVATSDADREHQERWFERQIQWSVELRLPLVIHCVRAHGRCWELLRTNGAEAVGGVIHAYSSSPEMAEQYQNLGFAIGIGSPVTRAQSRRVRAAAAAAGDDWLLLETDAPYMNIETNPKGEGRPENIARVVEVVALLRETDQKALQQQTARNFERIFRKEFE